MSERWILLLNAAATLYMTGLIWFVQVVHYPLFAKVGAEGFASYERSHAQLTNWVVTVPMLMEFATACLLLAVRPANVSRLEAWIGVSLVVAIWASTWLLQVPRHGQLATGFDAQAHHALVLTNWIRTLAWSARGLLVLMWLARSH